VLVPTGTPPHVHALDLDRGVPSWTIALGADPESEAVVAGLRLLITSGGAVKVFSFGNA
jgi:hypothetical protein